MNLYRITVPVVSSGPRSVGQTVALGLTLRHLLSQRKQFYPYVVGSAVVMAAAHYDVILTVNARKAVSPEEWTLERRRWKGAAALFDPLPLLEAWLEEDGIDVLDELLGDVIGEVAPAMLTTLWESYSVEEVR